MENNDIIKIARNKAEKWLDKAYDEKTRAEAKRMLENTDTTELVESFYNDLEFGTGGLRGIMGVGTNRMNIYTLLKVFQTTSTRCFRMKRKPYVSVMTAAITPDSFQKRPPIFSRPTGYMFTCSRICAPRLKCHLPSGS